jgi:hypothetical protein
MLEAFRLQDIAKKIVSDNLPTIILDEVLTENTSTSDGEAALRITLVLTPESVDAISGEDALKLLVDIRDGLLREGEERFPILEYATADDLGGDDE